MCTSCALKIPIKNDRLKKNCLSLVEEHGKRACHHPLMSYLTADYGGGTSSVKPTTTSFSIYLLACFFLLAGCIQNVSSEDCLCSPRASLKEAFEKVPFEDWDQFRLKKSILDSIDLPHCNCLPPKKFERIPFKDWDQFRLKRGIEYAGDSSNSKRQDQPQNNSQKQVYYWTPYKRQQAYNMWRKGKRTSYRTKSRTKSTITSGPLFLSSTSSMGSNTPLSTLRQRATKQNKVQHTPEIKKDRNQRKKSRTNSLNRLLEKNMQQRIFRRSSSRLSNLDDLGPSIGRFEKSLFNYPSHKRLRQWRKGS